MPSARQLQWHKMAFYGFLHFTVNTFTDKEWGYGDESPSVFAPTGFDADRIADTAARGGMRGLAGTTDGVQLRVEGPVCPALSELALFMDPEAGKEGTRGDRA